MHKSPPDPQATPAAEPALPPLANRLDSTRRAIDDQLFDGGDTLIDDGITRANWAVPWSDLMMTMFVLFAALLAVQAVHERTKQQPTQHQMSANVQQQEVRREKIVKEQMLSPVPTFEPLTQVNVLARSEEVVRETDLQNAEIVLLDDQSVKVSVHGPMFFALGSADLRPEVTLFLDRLAQIIKQTPFDIHVVGHTDDRPINTIMFPSNWELSLIRASRVARYLIKSENLDPSRFVVMGRGEFAPATVNADERARWLNRRVDIIITREIDKSEDAKRQ
jgi:chemotaxis protein MotB